MIFGWSCSTSNRTMLFYVLKPRSGLDSWLVYCSRRKSPLLGKANSTNLAYLSPCSHFVLVAIILKCVGRVECCEIGPASWNAHTSLLALRLFTALPSGGYDVTTALTNKALLSCSSVTCYNSLSHTNLLSEVKRKKKWYISDTLHLGVHVTWWNSLEIGYRKFVWLPSRSQHW